jgi:predicted enzyme related to lactoylglutathione lyase
MTRFKELCLDVSATDRVTGAQRPRSNYVGAFWAALTGCSHQAEPDGPGDVVGEEEGMGIALCPVPEPKTVKNRVHIDVSVGSLDEVTDRGGRILETHEHWTVCADPAGNEFCAFVRDEPLPAYRTFEVVVDAADPERIARWWGEVFGVEARNDGRRWWWLQDVPGMPTSGPFFAWVFGPVPEPKTVKNRLHWDLYGETDDLLARGATHLWDVPGRSRTVAWSVLADPEGNEFCVFPD